MMLEKIKNTLGRSGFLSIALVYAATLVAGAVFVLNQGQAFAVTGHLEPRQLQVSSSAPGNVTLDEAGNTVPAFQGGNGQQTSETFTFTIPLQNDGQTIKSLAFVWCTTPLPGTECDVPTGLNVHRVTSNGSPDTQTDKPSGATAAAFGSPYTYDTNTTCGDNTATPGIGDPGQGSNSVTNANCLLLTNSTGNALAQDDQIVFRFGGQSDADSITNPTVNGTFFVRISLYTDAAYQNKVALGTVASAITNQINVTAKVEETLHFSVGVPAKGGSVTSVDKSSACTPLENLGNGDIALGDPTNGVLTFLQAYTNTSYFRIDTNSTDGTQVQYSGKTLTSGGDTIAPMTTAAVSTPGTSQFGIAIDQADSANTVAASQAGTGDQVKVYAVAPYGLDVNNTPNVTGSDNTDEWAFDPTSITNPVVVAKSDGIIKCDTGAISYLGNQATTTPAGVYTTTMTYIAVPKY